MAETPSKRPREDDTLVVNEDEVRGLKRQKSINDIVLSLLDDEVDGDEQPEPEFQLDISTIFTTLQRELSFDDPLSLPDPVLDNPVSDPSPAASVEDERERVMRHLLEASDDELGLPNIDGGDEGEVVVMNGGDAFSFGGDDGLWELEDEAANYYTLLQSELFM